jgi:nicotinamide mononucleotide transporter
VNGLFGWANALAFQLGGESVRWSDLLGNLLGFVGSLAATLCQGRGWVEFWFVWIAVDLVGVPLAFHSGLPVSGFTYAIYFVLVIAGMRQWIQLARSAAASSSPSPRPFAESAPVREGVHA